MDEISEATLVNLEPYFQRIQFAPVVGEDRLVALCRLVKAHATSIPFENIDVLRHHAISLQDQAVDEKLVVQRRGGYCFEHAGLLMRVLKAMGYEATPLSARVRYLQSRDVIPPRTHLFLKVELDDRPWMVDVGIGGLSATAPVAMDRLGQEQATPHELRRILCENAVPFPKYFQQAKLGETWCDVSEFTLEAMPSIDCELANWWTSTHPNSRFRQNLIVALAHADGTRSNILNREFTHRRGGQIIERFEFRDEGHLRSVLRDRYQLEWDDPRPLIVPAITWM